MRGLRLGFGVGVGGGIVSAYPSLIMDFVPTAGIEVERSSRTFDQLIDFTRTSSATYVDETGKIVSTPASRNLLTFTQEFDNAAWAKQAITVAANGTTAPDGTLTGDTLVANPGAAVHNVGQNTTVTMLPYTWSIYAKAGTSSFMQLVHTASSNTYANFDLATGSVGTVGSLATATMTSVGNGWYRCSLTFTPSTGSFMRVAMISSATAAFNESWTAAGTETIFIWGAQLEANTTATDYTRNNGGVYPPRFDYDPVTLAPRGLLVEEQRTNLLLRSEEFDNASWSKSRSSVTANATTSPDGTVDADKLVEDTTAASTHFTTQTATVASGATVTCSVYAKAAERTRVVVQENNSGATVAVNLANGSIISGSGTVQDAGNGWYRISVTGTVPATTAIMGIYLRDATSSSYTGDGTSGIYIWGAQLEAGAFATSYIPTVASQVTRTADVATITGANFSQWYNQSEGTLLVEGSVYATAGSGNRKTVSAITEGNFNNIARTAVEAAGPATNAGITVGGVTQATFVGATVAANIPFKMALAMRANDFAFCADGGAVRTDTSGSVVSAPIVLDLGFGPQNSTGSTNTAGDYLNGHLRSLRYYPAKLSDSQLQALTV